MTLLDKKLQKHPADKLLIRHARAVLPELDYGIIGGMKEKLLKSALAFGCDCLATAQADEGSWEDNLSARYLFWVNTCAVVVYAVAVGSQCESPWWGGSAAFGYALLILLLSHWLWGTVWFACVAVVYVLKNLKALICWDWQKIKANQKMLVTPGHIRRSSFMLLVLPVVMALIFASHANPVIRFAAWASLGVHSVLMVLTLFKRYRPLEGGAWSRRKCLPLKGKTSLLVQTAARSAILAVAQKKD